MKIGQLPDTKIVANLNESFERYLLQKSINLCDEDLQVFTVLTFCTLVIIQFWSWKKINFSMITFGRVHGIFLLSKTPMSGLEPTPASSSIDTGIFTSKAKRPYVELSSNAKVNNEWRYNSTPPYVFMACTNNMIHRLAAIGLTPGGSSTVHIYTQTVHRTTH